MKTILFRADDAGSSEGANEAIFQAAEAGVVRNISVMAPGPALEHASEILAALDGVDFGLHVTLNSEWENVKWGPVLPATEVPSLVDENGHFTREPKLLHERGFSVDEAEAEVVAQLAKLRSAGFRVDYLDEHMGVGWLPGLSERLEAIARREGLVMAKDIDYLETVVTGDLDQLIDCIKAGTDESPFVIVFHPVTNSDPVARQFTFGGTQPGEILRERAQERRILTDPRLKATLEIGGYRSVGYRLASEWVVG